MSEQLGVVIGKFLPPHGGHHHLIEVAIGGSDRVVVIVCVKPSDPIPGELRVAWLREAHPAAEIFEIDDRYDENDSKVWAENTIRWLGRAPDLVFTSEDYGEIYAAMMEARHVMVDKARLQVPTSGTAIRNDPYKNWDFLRDPARGWFAKRVCIVGAESTGTTTLACDLARVMNTEWVEEYGREYSAQKAANADEDWDSNEFIEIAREQSRRENEAARRCNRVLICDTNAWVTGLWHRRYLGNRNEELDELGRSVVADLYLLTGDEIPFVQDGLRDGAHIRSEMQGWFEAALRNQSTPWAQVEGSRERRLARAHELVLALFEDSAWKPGARS